MQFSRHFIEAGILAPCRSHCIQFCCAMHLSTPNRKLHLKPLRPISPIFSSAQHNKHLFLEPTRCTDKVVRSRNIHSRIFRRELGSRTTVTFDAVPRRLLISLDSLIDAGGEILNGCIILGFTKDGAHLVSYSCETEESFDTPLGAKGYYKIQWWRFDGEKPLQKKAEAFLFGSRDVGVNVPPDVHLQITIMQTADESLFIVHGSAITQTPEDQGPKENFISIIPSPLLFSGDPTPRVVSFKYEVSSPFVVDFAPHLSFLPPNVLLLNTGSGIRVLQWTVVEAESSASVRPSTPNLIAMPSHGFWSRSASPPVEIRDHCLVRVGPVTSYDDIVDSCLTVKVFDAEMYVQSDKEKLPSMKQYSLVDYDINIVQLFEEEQKALLLLLAIFRKSNSGKKSAPVQSRTASADTLRIGFLVLFDPYKGEAETLKIVTPVALEEVPSSREVTETGHAISACLRQKWRLNAPVSFHAQCSSWSNKTVHTGRSLSVIPHPFFPIALYKPNSSVK